MPYWWRVTTQIWVVLLVEANFPPGTTNQKHYPGPGSDVSSALVSKMSFRGETSGGVTNYRPFSQATRGFAARGSSFVGPQAIPKHPAIREEETPGTQGNRISRLSV